MDSGCPYVGCDGIPTETDSKTCSICGYRARLCEACDSTNRLFASYCRICGIALRLDHAKWTQHGGGVLRTGAVEMWQGMESVKEPVVTRLLTEESSLVCGGLVSGFGMLYGRTRDGLVIEVSQEDLKCHRKWPFHERSESVSHYTTPILSGTDLFVFGQRMVTRYPLISEDMEAKSLTLSEELEIVPNRVAIAEDYIFLVVYNHSSSRQQLICLLKDVSRVHWTANSFSSSPHISAPLIIKEHCVVGDSEGRVSLFRGASGPNPTEMSPEKNKAPLGFNIRVNPVGIEKKAYFLSNNLENDQERILYQVNVASQDKFPVKFARLGSCSPIALNRASRFWFIQLSDGYFILDEAGLVIGRQVGRSMIGVRDDIPPTIIGSYTFSLTNSGKVYTTIVHDGKCFTRPYFPDSLQNGGAFTSLVPGDGALFGAREDGILCKIGISGGKESRHC